MAVWSQSANISGEKNTGIQSGWMPQVFSHTLQKTRTKRTGFCIELSNIDAQTPQTFLFVQMYIQYPRERDKVHGTVNKQIPLDKWER